MNLPEFRISKKRIKIYKYIYPVSIVLAVFFSFIQLHSSFASMIYAPTTSTSHAFFFFTLSFFICMPSHPLFVNPDRIQDENSKKGFPRGQIDIDDIDSTRRFNRHFLRVFVGKASFHRIYFIFLVCIAFHVFFKHRDMLHS